MTLEDIYAEISAHMIKGLMIHEQFANYYDFLGLCGYKKCHEYHYYEESCNFRKLNSYFINHHNKLIPYKEFENPSIIPSKWYAHERGDVDFGTRKAAIRDGMIKWVEWEKQTKILYEQMYKTLVENDEVASATFVEELIRDVDYELAEAEMYYINKEAIGYDIVSIIEEQKSLEKTYIKKICKCIDK